MGYKSRKKATNPLQVKSKVPNRVKENLLNCGKLHPTLNSYTQKLIKWSMQFVKPTQRSIIIGSSKVGKAKAAAKPG